MTSYEFKPIAHVNSPFKEKFGTPRQAILVPSAKAEIEFESWINVPAATEGLEGFSHIWIVFVFHLHLEPFTKSKVHPPRLDGKKTGVLASRSPHRYNPVGLSCVKFEGREGTRKLLISGVDLVDGTPVLDIKPYIPYTDSIADAHSSWTLDKPHEQLIIEYTEEALRELSDRQTRSPRIDLKALIEESLALDPRSIVYKGTAERPQPYGETYGMNLLDFNLVFEVPRPGLARVLRFQKSFSQR